MKGALPVSVATLVVFSSLFMPIFETTGWFGSEVNGLRLVVAVLDQGFTVIALPGLALGVGYLICGLLFFYSISGRVDVALASLQAIIVCLAMGFLWLAVGERYGLYVAALGSVCVLVFSASAKSVQDAIANKDRFPGGREFGSDTESLNPGRDEQASLIDAALAERGAFLFDGVFDGVRFHLFVGFGVTFLGGLIVAFFIYTSYAFLMYGPAIAWVPLCLHAGWHVKRKTGLSRRSMIAAPLVLFSASLLPQLVTAMVFGLVHRFPWYLVDDWIGFYLISIPVSVLLAFVGAYIASGKAKRDSSGVVQSES